MLSPRIVDKLHLLFERYQFVRWALLNLLENSKKFSKVFLSLFLSGIFD